MFGILIPAAMADPNYDTIAVTLTPGGTVDVTVTPDTWTGIGTNRTAKVGDIGLTNTTNTTFNIENTGTAQVSVTIGAAMVASTWTYITTGSPVEDEVALKYQKPLGAWTYIAAQASPAAFITALPAEGGTDNQDFGLGVLMPPTSSVAAAQSILITFSATAT